MASWSVAKLPGGEMTGKRKHSPAARVTSTFPSCSQMPVVFYHSVIHGLGFFIDIKVMWLKTVKHAFSMFYTLIKHGFLTNQSVRSILSIL